MLSPWTGSSARISAALSVSHLPAATAGALFSLQPTLYSQALPAQGSCCKLCSSQFSFPLRTINCYLSSSWILVCCVSWKIGAFPCEIWELSKYQGEKIWGPATLQLCHPAPSLCLSVPQLHILSLAASGIDRKPPGTALRPQLTSESVMLFLSFTPFGPYCLADLWCLTCFISVINPTFLNVLSGSFGLMLITPSH